MTGTGAKRPLVPKDSATIKAARSVQLGRTKETQAFGRPELACLSNNPLAGSAEKNNSDRCDESVPVVEAGQQYPWLWIRAFAGKTAQSFRTIYRRYRRCCH
jgi:hypothetical protein